ncbi:TIGR01458 family HAD-type hydrolase [Parvibaculum sp.]|uniref:TIGR01458 family HAD-type hydrolase n=1 Tax=Parvibaculum sp. TaxID=2024848 RepID=UPI0032971104
MAPEAKPLRDIKGLLIDVGGVLYQGDEAIEGSVEALKGLRERKLPFRLLTNTTRTSRARLAAKLKGFGFDVNEAEIVTPASVAGAVLARDGAKPRLLVHPDLVPDCPAEAAEPDAVLIGDAGEHFTFEAMNRAFNVLIEGGKLYALGKNRFFRGKDGYELDAGPFVAALEFAAEVEAVLIGKPSRAFFETAAKDMNLTPENVAMVGDDVESDVEGAIAAGLGGILVRTGKFREADGERAKKGGAHVAASLAAVVEELSA